MAETKFRDEIAEAFIKSIEADPLTWRKQWSCPMGGRPFNAVKTAQYNGINALYLSYVSHAKGYKDPRWATFKQASEKGWKIKAGEHGYKVEYWMPKDNLAGQIISWAEYNAAIKNGSNLSYTDEDGKKHERYSIKVKYFTVFNGTQIEGIEPFVLQEIKNDIKPSVIVEKVSKGMGVPIYEDKNKDRAFYSPMLDEIHLPAKEQFDNDHAYQATALHELAHATGHQSRLNRDHNGMMGSSEYAFEELVAEMSSAFMSEYFEAEMPKEELKNHAAYVQSWAESIRKDRNFLFKAIKLAEEASDYMVEKGDLEILKIHETEHEKTEEIVISKKEEEFEI